MVIPISCEINFFTRPIRNLERIKLFKFSRRVNIYRRFIVQFGISGIAD